VAAGKSQRRPGLHVDSPGIVKVGKSTEEFMAWGKGYRLDQIQDGIFLSTNVSNSCRIWDNCNIEVVPGIVGPHGDIEHFRPLLDKGKLVKAGQLWWLSDVSPHESLPVEQDTYRQFFRLVVGPVGGWYAAHSTPNLLCVPDVVVITGNKFDNS